MDLAQQKEEVGQAIEAGELALKALENADHYLSSARGWGLFDLFGGGAFSSFIKHQRLSQAQQAIDKAAYQLRLFTRELNDVVSVTPVSVQVDTFIQLIDIFADNFFVDVLVQSKIANAQRQVAATKVELQKALNALYRLR